MRRTVHVYRLGTVRYQEAHALQERLVTARQQGLVPDTVLVLEHPPVITLGRGAKEDHLRSPREGLRARGIDVHEVGRGGDVTYHGPGQMVCYPILDLAPDRQDVRRYVRDLEETMIGLAADYGLVAERIPGFNGTWLRSRELGDRKIGAIGVRISRWVTMHGLAFNVSTNLAHFGLIVPCGIQDKGVTSLRVELDAPPTMDQVIDRWLVRFGAALDTDVVEREGDPLAGVDLAALEAATI
jgi:lipoyl(octanoyl) transferase